MGGGVFREDEEGVVIEVELEEDEDSADDGGLEIALVVLVFDDIVDV